MDNFGSSGMSGGTVWNPSRAMNGGLSALGFAPDGIGALLSMLYGGYQGGFEGQTSQNNEGMWGYVDPTEPGFMQNFGNWLGSGIAQLLGYGNPQMSMAQGQAGNNQSFSSNMNNGSGFYNSGSVNVTPRQSNPYSAAAASGYNGGFDPTNVVGNASGSRPYYGTMMPSSVQQMGDVGSGFGNFSSMSKTGMSNLPAGNALLGGFGGTYAPTGAGNISGPSFFGGMFSSSNPSTTMQMGPQLDLGSMGDFSQASKGGF